MGICFTVDASANKGEGTVVPKFRNIVHTEQPNVARFSN